MVALHQSKHPFMRRAPTLRFANELGDVADLLPDEQSELALKLRFGIGVEQLTGEPLRAGPTPRNPSPAPAPADPRREPRSDAEVRARAAALGVSAGRRGQWLR